MGKKKSKKITNLNVSDNFNKRLTDYSMLLKELSSLTKKEGLVIGTNAVLRSLEKKSLAAVFLFSKIANSCIYHSLSLWCQATDAELVLLKENDKYILGPNFPKSVTYGIQKKSLDALPSIYNLLENLKTSKKVKSQDSETHNQENVDMDLDVKSTEEIPEDHQGAVQKPPKIIELSGSLSFHHKHHSRIPKTLPTFKENEFLGITQLDFPQYDMQSYPVKVKKIKKRKRK